MASLMESFGMVKVFWWEETVKLRVTSRVPALASYPLIPLYDETAADTMLSKIIGMYTLEITARRQSLGWLCSRNRERPLRTESTRKVLPIYYSTHLANYDSMRSRRAAPVEGRALDSYTGVATRLQDMNVTQHNTI